MKTYYRQILEGYLTRQNLKNSEPRWTILEEVIALNRHFTVENLYLHLKNRHLKIGQATVYRTVKLFCASGICQPLTLEDGTVQYELVSENHHHDHLICLGCGKMMELSDPQIEALQEKLALEKGFKLLRHRLEMYGLCPRCQNQ